MLWTPSVMAQTSSADDIPPPSGRVVQVPVEPVESARANDTVSAAKPASKRRNTSMMVAGIVMTSVGGVLLLPAAGLAAQGKDDEVAASVPFWVLSVVHLAVGIPLWAVGGSKPRAQASAGLPSYIPEVAIGIKRAQLSWRF